MAEAYLYDALRTPLGEAKPTGALYEVKPVSLLAAALAALAQRQDLPLKAIEDLIVGCATPVDDQGHHIAQAALQQSSWGNAELVNRGSASGLEAINLAAMKVRSGWADLVVAGGLESMSRVPLGSDGGPLRYDPEVLSKAAHLPQGITADLLATLAGFSREALDRYALQSWQRAAQAAANGNFSASIIPIYDRNGLLILGEDESLGQLPDPEGLAQLPPAFASVGQMGFDEIALRHFPWLERIEHEHSLGNIGQPADGAALMLVGSKTAGEALGLKPRARLRAAALAPAAQSLRLDGSAPAASQALRLAGMTSEDIELWECHEAYAAVVLHFQRELDIDDAALNVNGGAIALGYPMGAIGAVMLVNLLDELERRDLGTGLAAISASGGMGVATIIERV